MVFWPLTLCILQENTETLTLSQTIWHQNNSKWWFREFDNITVRVLGKLSQNCLKYIVRCVFPYLHGALHDRDGHDSILYGHSLSVHKSGMGYKIERILCEVYNSTSFSFT